MERHSKTALEVGEFLENSDYVESVSYPFLKSSKSYDLANKYLKGGSGVLSFCIKGDRDTAARFIERLELIRVADARSLALHPASSTHRQLSDENLNEGRIPKTRPSKIDKSKIVDDLFSFKIFILFLSKKASR
ncbi:MAG: PLP-dependent transferase [Anaerococcus sp.]|nr:PLP-dependent transferase [Anaerococcus sp.]